MEQKEIPKVAKKQVKKNEYSTVRIDKDSKRKLNNFLAKVNKKDHGQRVKEMDVLRLILEKLTDESIPTLQENSMSNHDRLERDYKQFVVKNGYISKDEYLGKRLAENL